MNLTIDIGNTTAKLAAFDAGQLIDHQVVSNETLEGLTEFVNRHMFTQGILSTVIELSCQAECALAKLTFPLLRLSADLRLPIVNQYQTPRTLGQDRIAAVVGGITLFPERDLLLIDAGTCITYDFVSASGVYEGGNISPGLEMRLKALHYFTSKLPEIESQGEAPTMGYSTETAIRSGVVKGIQYEMEGYIRHFLKTSPKLVLLFTGGNQFDLDNSLKNLIFADKFIVPKGLNRILEYNDSI